MEKEKRGPGQPKKPDAKIKMAGFRLRPDVVEIIRSQPNQSAFIEDLVLKYDQSR